MCIEVCLAAECKSWTRIQYDTQYNKKGECWMRSKENSKKPSGQTNSGIKSGTRQDRAQMLNRIELLMQLQKSSADICWNVQVEHRQLLQAQAMHLREENS